MNSRKINIYSNLQNLVPSIYLNGKCPGSTLALISALLALSPLATTKCNNNFIDTVILLQVTKIPTQDLEASTGFFFERACREVSIAPHEDILILKKYLVQNTTFWRQLRYSDVTLRGLF